MLFGAVLSLPVASLAFLLLLLVPFSGGTLMAKRLDGPLLTSWSLALPFWGLGVWWWLSLVILALRMPPLPPPGIPQSIRRMAFVTLLAPLFAFTISAVFVLTVVPSLQLSLFGETITQPVRIEKIGTVRDYPTRKRRARDPQPVRTCYTTILVHLPSAAPARLCLRHSLYRSLKPGDGLRLRYVIYGAFYRVTPSRLAAEELPEEIRLDPALRPYIAQRFD